MSVRVSTKVGNHTWLTTGPFGWLVIAVVGLAVAVLALMWPLWAVTELFPHQGWADIVGWLLTVVWWILVAGWFAATKPR